MGGGGGLGRKGVEEALGGGEGSRGQLYYIGWHEIRLSQ